MQSSPINQPATDSSDKEEVSPSPSTEMQAIEPGSVTPENGKFYHILYEFHRDFNGTPEELAQCFQEGSEQFFRTLAATTRLISEEGEEFGLSIETLEKIRMKEVQPLDFPLYLGWAYVSSTLAEHIRDFKP
jgi:hypothetical protein